VTSVAAAQAHATPTGVGSLEGAWGAAHLVDNGMELRGGQDIFADAVSTSTLASGRSAGAARTGGIWNGRMWSGTNGQAG
jgi:hypothetical protein